MKPNLPNWLFLVGMLALGLTNTVKELAPDTLGRITALHWGCAIVSAILFSIGVGAFLIKRNIITVFMSIELMLNAVNLTFVAFAYQWHRVQGQIFVFFVMVVAAAEAAVGLAIIIAIFRSRSTLNVDQVNLMKL